MPRLSRKLRVCKWLGTMGCALLVGVLALSWYWSLGYVWLSRGYVHSIVLDYGATNYCGVPRSLVPTSSAGWFIEPQRKPDWWERAYSRLDFEQILMNRIFFGGPLRVPLFFLFVPTLLLWWRNRRVPHPGFCARCDYDLTGNESGICPECGSKVAGEGSARR